MKKLNDKLRKNPYIVSTIALALFCIVITVGDIIEARSIDKTENEILCSIIYATPAWASNGKLVSYGLMTPQNISIDLVNTVLIPERVKMLYNSNCLACEKQIDYYKGQGTWEDYQKEGLTIDCSKKW